MEEFKEFWKIARYSRECVVTEKLDGKNGVVLIVESEWQADPDALVNSGGLALYAGSRTRWVTESDDNYGFARWAKSHAEELLTGLGVGRHYGEWWGNGIQRGYGLENGDKRWSLFNVSRWCLAGSTPALLPSQDPRVVKVQSVLPACVGLVPVLWSGMFDALDANAVLANLERFGSAAVPRYMKPEGIVVYHKAGNVCFTKTLVKDEEPKGARKRV